MCLSQTSFRKWDTKSWYLSAWENFTARVKFILKTAQWGEKCLGYLVAQKSALLISGLSSNLKSKDKSQRGVAAGIFTLWVLTNTENHLYLLLRYKPLLQSHRAKLFLKRNYTTVKNIGTSLDTKSWHVKLKHLVKVKPPISVQVFVLPITGRLRTAVATFTVL